MDATPEELAELYRERWKVEQGFRSIKSDLRLDYLRCTTPDLIHKEFSAHMLAYNLLRKIICEAAADRHPNEISLKGCSQILLAFLNNPDFYDQMLTAVGSHVVGQRPNRSEPRVRKRRPKSYPLMTRPRGVA
jgi:hypothetical protein